MVDIFLFQQIDKVFNNIGADFLTGSESESKEDGLQNKHKRVSFFTCSYNALIYIIGLLVNYRFLLGKTTV